MIPLSPPPQYLSRSPSLPPLSPPILKALLSRAARGTFQLPPPPPAPSVQICIPTVPTPSPGVDDLGFERALGVVPKAGLSRRTCPARSRWMQPAGLGEGAQRGGRGGGQRPCQERFLLASSRGRRAEAADEQDFRRHVPRAAAAVPQCLIKMVLTLQAVACRGSARPGASSRARLDKPTQTGVQPWGRENSQRRGNGGRLETRCSLGVTPACLQSLCPCSHRIVES